MAYSTGMMKYRVTVAKRYQDTQETFGKSGQPKYELLGTFWMAETFTKGVKAMHEGALDAYDTVMIRMRWNNFTTRDSLLIYDGITYQILSFHADKQENEIQITACELVQGAPYPAPTPTPTPTPTPDPDENDNENEVK